MMRLILVGGEADGRVVIVENDRLALEIGVSEPVPVNGYEILDTHFRTATYERIEFAVDGKSRFIFIPRGSKSYEAFDLLLNKYPRTFQVGKLDDETPENREALLAVAAGLRLGYSLKFRHCHIDVNHSEKVVTIQSRYL